MNVSRSKKRTGDEKSDLYPLRPEIVAIFDSIIKGYGLPRPITSFILKLVQFL